LREVPRIVWVLAVGQFFAMASAFLMLFLSLYLTGPRGMGTVEAGVLAGCYGAGILAGYLTGGRWGDRWGHHRVLVTAPVLAAVLVGTVPWQPVALLWLALPVSAYLSATAGLSNAALAALAVEKGSRRTSVAIGRAFSNAGFVIGPPLGAVIAAHSWDAVFVVDAAMTLVVRFCISRVLTAEAPRERSGGPSLWAALRADRGLLVMLPAVVLADLVYRQLYATVPLRLRDAGEPLGLYTGLNALGSGLILLFEIPIAIRLRRLDSQPIVAAGYLLLGVGMAGFGLPVTIGSAIGAMVVLTAGEILYKTTATAHVLDAAPEHLVGQYQGLYTAAATSGTMLAAPLGMAVYASMPAALWPACLAVAAVAAGLMLGSRRRTGRNSVALTP
jgi:MFS family permease